MDIFEILANLGIDIADSEAKAGVKAALGDILKSRIDISATPVPPPPSLEVDPELLQPSKKSSPAGFDIEYDDAEDLMSKVKHNDSDSGTPQQSRDKTGSSGSGTEGDSQSKQDSDTGADGGTGNTDSTGDTGAVGAKSSAGDASADGTQSDTSKADDTSADGTQSADGKVSDTGADGTQSDAGKAGATGANSTQSDTSEAGDTDTGADGTKGDPGKAGDADVQADIIDTEAKKKIERRQIQQERVGYAAEAAAEAGQTKGASQEKLDALNAAVEALMGLSEDELAEISDGDFNALIGKVFAAMDALGSANVVYTTDDERKLRAQKIQRELSDIVVQSDIYDDDLKAIRRDKATTAAQEAEKEKYAQQRSNPHYGGFEAFIRSLRRAIARQVTTAEKQVDSWAAIDRRRGSSSVLRPGQVRRQVPSNKIPIIDFYFDYSGSWGPKDIEMGKKAMKALIDLETDEKGEKKLIINPWYFANVVGATPAEARSQGSGTRAWNHIIRNIQETKATNVVIMTDSDMQDSGGYGGFLSHTVKGHVWFLWRDGESAPRLPQDLQGRAGTTEFSFTTS